MGDLTALFQKIQSRIIHGMFLGVRNVRRFFKYTKVVREIYKRNPAHIFSSWIIDNVAKKS